MKILRASMIGLAVLGVAGLLGAQPAGNRRKAATPVARGFDAYKLIVDRNIFDPGRRPAGARPAAQQTKASSVTTINLAGAVVQEGQRLAIVSSTVADHNGARRVGDSVAGFRIDSIDTDGVVLVRNDTKKKWPVGGALRRIDDGDWYLPETPGNTGDITKDPAAEAAILKRLRQRREQEK